MKLKNSTIIDGFDVTIECFKDCGNDRCDCYITKDEYRSSLQFAEQKGFIVDVDDERLPVDSLTLTKIRQYATENGL